jgi:hypothetical protein
MHTLYPPLDDSTPSCNNNSHQNNQDMRKVDNVMSPELRQNFETMKSLKRKDPPGTREMCDAHETKKRQLAIETAIAVEKEMSRLRHGIAELEAILAEQENEDIDITVFPFLPPVIPADDDDPNDDESIESDSNSSEASGGMVHQ